MDSHFSYKPLQWNTLDNTPRPMAACQAHSMNKQLENLNPHEYKSASNWHCMKHMQNDAGD
jgi:hypothetical protein